MSDVKNSILETIMAYTAGVMYLAQEDKKLVNDTMLLIVVDQLYDWADWMGAEQQVLLNLQNFRKNIIRNNSKIKNLRTVENKYYKNVSTPQTIYTWQRIYDDPAVETYETL